MGKEKEINPGGLTGTGKGVININSKEYKYLKEAIEEHAKGQTITQKIDYRLMGLKFKMESYAAENNPDPLIELGAFLRWHLEALTIKQKSLANYLDIEASNLNAILNGKRKLTVELALKLGQLFQADASLWLQIQNKNELIKLQNNLKQQSLKRYDLGGLLAMVKEPED